MFFLVGSEHLCLEICFSSQTLVFFSGLVGLYLFPHLLYIKYLPFVFEHVSCKCHITRFSFSIQSDNLSFNG